MMTQMNPKLPMKQTDDFLCHHGEKGQKWGIRRYQNPDGSLTPLGRRHWGIGPPRDKPKRKSFRLETAEDRKERLELKAKKKAEKAELRKQRAENNLAKKKFNLINNGDRAEIYKNRKLFTDEELAYADRRISAAEKFNVAKAEEKSIIDKATDARKEALLNNGDLIDIYNNRKLFTNEELRNAVARAEMLSKMDPKQKKDAKEAPKKAFDGKSFTDKTIDNLGKAAKVVGGVGALAVTGWEAYNKIASVMNESNKTFFNDSDRESIIKKLGDSELAQNPKTSKFIDFFTNTALGNMPVGTMDPYSKLKASKAKFYNENQFKGLFPKDTDSELISDIYDKIFK